MLAYEQCAVRSLIKVHVLLKPHKLTKYSPEKDNVLRHGPVWCSGLKSLLQTRDDLELIGEASEGKEGIRLAEKLKPDLVLLFFGSGFFNSDLRGSGSGAFWASRHARYAS